MRSGGGLPPNLKLAPDPRDRIHAPHPPLAPLKPKRPVSPAPARGVKVAPKHKQLRPGPCCRRRRSNNLPDAGAGIGATAGGEQAAVADAQYVRPLSAQVLSALARRGDSPQVVPAKASGSGLGRPLPLDRRDRSLAAQPH